MSLAAISCCRPRPAGSTISMRSSSRATRTPRRATCSRATSCPGSTTPRWTSADGRRRPPYRARARRGTQRRYRAARLAATRPALRRGHLQRDGPTDHRDPQTRHVDRVRLGRCRFRAAGGDHPVRRRIVLPIYRLDDRPAGRAALDDRGRHRLESGSDVPRLGRGPGGRSLPRASAWARPRRYRRR